MKVCDKCGHELNDNVKFCVKCGTPVKDDDNNEKKVEKVVPKNAPKKEKEIKPKKEIDEKTMKKRKLLGIIALVVLVAVFSLYKIGESATSRDKVVEKFITAITENNTTELAKMIKSSDPRMEINEDNLKPLIDYLDENPSFFDYLIETIEEEPEVNNEIKKKDINVFSKETNTDMISLRKRGKKLFFYDNYEFVMQPFFVTLSTNYEDAVLYINDKELGKSDSDNFTKEFGPFAPGKHTVKVVYTGEYANLETERDINLITNRYNSDTKLAYIDLYLEGNYVYIDTNLYDGQVIVNGKNIGMTVREINEEGLGPVDDSTKVQLSREFPWGTINTEEVTIGDVGPYLGLYFDPKNEDVETAVIEAINTFLREDMLAFNERDAEKYTNLLDPELNRRRQAIEDNIMYERYTVIEMVNAIYDLNSFRISLMNNEYQAELYGLYNYKSGYFYEGEEVPELTDKTSRWAYYLKYDIENDKWLIYTLNSIYSFNDKNVKEFTFSDN